MRAAVGLMDGLGLDSDRCIRVIPRHTSQMKLTKLPLVDCFDVSVGGYLDSERHINVKITNGMLSVTVNDARKSKLLLSDLLAQSASLL